LASFIKNGYEVVLYSFEEIRDLPDGVQRADARKIVDRSYLDRFITNRATNVAAFSSYFRYLMFLKTDLCWTDTDIFMLQGFEINPNDNFFVVEDGRNITDGCMPDFSDAYNYTLPSKRKVTETDYSEVSKEKAGKLAFGATAVAKPDLMSRLLGKLSFSASRKEKSGAAIDGTAEFEQSVRLISYRGNHWVVGDDFRGDPSNEGSWLRGEYFYEDPIKPLCTVDLPDEDTMATVRIEVWARPGQIFIYDLDANGRPTYEAESRSRREALDIIEVNSGFRTRARLRGMVLAEALRAVRPEQLPLIDAKSLPPAYLLDCVAIQMPSFPIDSSH
jgi:hypothetical protein